MRLKWFFLTSLIFPQTRMLRAAGTKRVCLFSLPTPRKRESLSVFGAYAPAIGSFYWKSAPQSNANVFRSFIHQLRAKFGDKKLAIVLDNASIHGCKFIKNFLLKYPEVKIFNLPTYSPEYNPTEQVWKWIKPLVHAAKTIEKGCEEIISRFRKIMAAWINKRLANPPNIGIGVWCDLLFKYL